MGKITGFLEYERLEEPHEEPQARKKHYREFYLRLADEDAKIQGARCMDCGIPFCMQGCPVNNIIPDFNDLVYRQDWQRAIETLHSTNNFPEFTGRVCPAPCEEACVLRINEDPVGIKSIEHAIIDKAWEAGWVQAAAGRAQDAARKSRSSAPVPRASPARSSWRAPGTRSRCSRRTTASAGCCATAFRISSSRSSVIDRRLEQMRAEGVEFRSGVCVGKAPPGKGVPNDAKSMLAPEKLLADFDAVVLSGGAEVPRDLPIPGRELARRALRDGIPAAAEQARRGRQGRRRNSGRRASTSSSSAAATRAPTASAPRTATAPLR